jgi:hypothetical protein
MLPVLCTAGFADDGFLKWVVIGRSEYDGDVLTKWGEVK